MIETIDFSKSEQYTLSIRLSADGFSFSVFNPLGEGELSFFDRKVEESLSLTANLKPVSYTHLGQALYPRATGVL